jgi:hypothetical protein
VPRAWIAQYPGTCGLCELPIKEGDECTFVDDEAVHRDCAEEDGYEVSEEDEYR